MLEITLSETDTVLFSNIMNNDNVVAMKRIYKNNSIISMITSGELITIMSMLFNQAEDDDGTLLGYDPDIIIPDEFAYIADNCYRCLPINGLSPIQPTSKYFDMYDSLLFNILHTYSKDAPKLYRTNYWMKAYHPKTHKVLTWPWEPHTSFKVYGITNSYSTKDGPNLAC